MDEKFWQSEEWLAFEKAARKRHFDAPQLLRDFMRDTVEVWEDAELHEAIRADVQKYIAIHGDIDPVEFVRQVRREVAAEKAAAGLAKPATRTRRRPLKRVGRQLADAAA